MDKAKKAYKRAKEYAKKVKDWAKANPKKALTVAACAAAFYFGAKFF